MPGTRTARLLVGAMAVSGVAVLSLASSAAASYTTYVGCSISQFAAPSHACQIGDQPGIFFESTEADVEYEVCVTFPDADEICAEEQEAEAEVLYVNELTTETPGNHLATWYVEGVEIASWSFRMDEPPAPTLPARPAPAPPITTVAPTGPATSLTAIGCSLGGGSTTSFAAHPRRCSLFRNGHRDHAHEIRMTNLHWQDWGGSTADASGRWKSCAKGACSSGPIEVTASRRIFACDRFAYTRISIHLFSPKRDRTYSLRLPSC